MKNIYEDSTNRTDAQDVMSGSFEKPENKTAFTPKTEKTAAQPPALQLTPEQISALVAQLVSARPDIVSDLLTVPKEQTEPEKLTKAPSEPRSPKDPGKRIVFQSEDFDDSSSGSDDVETYEDEAESLADLAAKESVSNAKSVRRTNVTFMEDDLDEEIDFSSAPAFKSRSFASEEISLPVGTEISVEDVDDDAFKPEKKKLGRNEIIRISILTAAIVAIIVSSVVLLKEYKLSKDNDKFEATVSDLIVDVTQAPDSSDGEKENEALSVEQQWAQIKNEYPNIIFPPRMQVKYAKLYATNPDFIGYLSQEEIGLSLPIVKAMDDETYLEKNFYGQNTKYGCPFVSYLNNIMNLDQNTVIFGHHMNNKTIFGTLDAYKTLEGYKKAPVITFNTLYSDYQWKVVAAMITNAEPEDDNGYVFQYYFTNLKNKENFSDYIKELSKRSLYDTGVDILPTDKLLTLSTCSHEFDNARFVVVARLVRSGESSAVNTENAVANNNPKYPQSYYNKLKKENPYKNETKWYIQ